MGYYSRFEVLDTDIETIQEDLQEISGYRWDCWNDTVQSSDCYKWYHWDEDLKELAKLHPNSYAVLERRGEESPDIERAIVFKGEVRTQSPEIKFPFFEGLPDLDTVVSNR